MPERYLVKWRGISIFRGEMGVDHLHAGDHGVLIIVFSKKHRLLERRIGAVTDSPHNF